MLRGLRVGVNPSSSIFISFFIDAILFLCVFYFILEPGILATKVVGVTTCVYMTNLCVYCSMYCIYLLYVV